MTHPADDLLTGYIDGTLAEPVRAAVDAHMAACARCTRDVARAAAARSALRAIPEVPVLEDVTIPSVAKASGRPGAPGWQRWAGAAAAVAAAALVAALVLPKLSGSSDGTNAGAAASTPSTRVGIQPDASQVPLEIRTADYGPDALTALAGQTAARLTSRPQGANAPEASGSGAGAVAPRVGTAEAAASATACIETAFREVPGSLVRLIRASFQGAPAYVGFYVETPGAGQATDMLTVRVASVHGCAPLSFAGVPL